jgi:dTDP-4-amino-4,6-dideoxygalactose transaminase
MEKIKFVDLKAQYIQIKDEMDKAIKDVIDNTAFIMGKNVSEFEKEFSEFCKSKYCIGVSNGTTALLIALKSAGIGEGDEVITSPNTFIATTEVITLCGAKIKFVDVDPKTYNLDPAKIKDAITPNTKAIIPVHLFGQPCEMDKIVELAQENNLIIIEDCAQAHGAEFLGQKMPFSDIGCFSFFPGKNLGAYGDAGGIVTNHDKILQYASAWRNHGRFPGQKYEHNFEGMNERLDALQGAILRVKLKHLDQWTENRRENAKLYNELLNNVGDVITPFESENVKHVYHLYVIRTNKRDELQEYLKKNDIPCGIHYPIPLHLQPAYEYLNLKEGSFPITEECAKTMLSLPMCPELTKEQISYIVGKIKEFFS